MKQPRSYVTFKDGHEEDIVYYHDHGPVCTLFATKSGVYIYSGFKLFTNCQFEKVVLRGPESSGYIAVIDETNIKSITLDERVPYEYVIRSDGAFIRGEILVPPSADNKKIRQLIAEDLDITYKKKED